MSKPCDHAERGGPCCLNDLVAPVNWCVPCQSAIGSLRGGELDIDRAREIEGGRITAMQSLYESTQTAVDGLAKALARYARDPDVAAPEVGS